LVKKLKILKREGERKRSGGGAEKNKSLGLSKKPFKNNSLGGSFKFGAPLPFWAVTNQRA